jgi:hypothetical protein
VTVKKKTAADPVAEVHSALQKMKAHAELHYGARGVYVGRECENHHRVLGIPYLPWQWLTDINGLLVGNLIGLAGQWMSHKTSLGLEFVRWAGAVGGAGEVEECEGGKFSPTLIESILGAGIYERQFAMNVLGSLEEAQGRLIWLADFFAKGKAEHLHVVLVDSLVGADSEK